MLLKLRQRMARDESGFTLVELLVVMLILGLLIAVAIPTFFNQKQKANDADSKAMAHTAQTAMETYATDHNGAYTGADLAALQTIESTIDGTVSIVGTPTAANYDIKVTNPITTHVFEIQRTGGTFAYPCTPGGQGGCPDDATPGGAGNWGG
jgi:prepilin-type N-terminal cleavage/methylation domain-containing protein